MSVCSSESQTAWSRAPKQTREDQDYLPAIPSPPRAPRTKRAQRASPAQRSTTSDEAAGSADMASAIKRLLDGEDRFERRARVKVKAPTYDRQGRRIPEAELRKIKRRITNRESAARMRRARQEHSAQLREEVGQLCEDNAELRRQLAEEQDKSRALRAQARRFRDLYRSASAARQEAADAEQLCSGPFAEASFMPRGSETRESPMPATPTTCFDAPQLQLAPGPSVEPEQTPELQLYTNELLPPGLLFDSLIPPPQMLEMPHPCERVPHSPTPPVLRLPAICTYATQEGLPKLEPFLQLQAMGVAPYEDFPLPFGG